MGRKYDEVLEDARRVPYKVVKAPNGDAWVEIRGKQYSPPEISALILRKLKEAAVQREAQTLAQLAARAQTQQSSGASSGSTVQEGEVIDAEPVETHDN